MPIVALKRKANAKYSNHSTDLGFSLNGTVRTRPSRIGQLLLYPDLTVQNQDHMITLFVTEEIKVVKWLLLHC